VLYAYWLQKIKPNDHVKIGLTNVIAAYIWIVRLYNGEFGGYENPEEITGAFISLSSFLGTDTIFSNFEHALADVSMSACRVRLKLSLTIVLSKRLVTSKNFKILRSYLKIKFEQKQIVNNREIISTSV